MGERSELREQVRVLTDLVETQNRFMNGVEFLLVRQRREIIDNWCRGVLPSPMIMAEWQQYRIQRLREQTSIPVDERRQQYIFENGSMAGFDDLLTAWEEGAGIT